MHSLQNSGSALTLLQQTMEKFRNIADQNLALKLQGCHFAIASHLGEARNTADVVAKIAKLTNQTGHFVAKRFGYVRNNNILLLHQALIL